MTSDAGQKAYWDLLETLRWICTRNEERVAAMWGMNEDDRLAVVMFDGKPEIDPSSLLILRGTNPAADRDSAVSKGNINRSRMDQATVMAPDKALHDLLMSKVDPERATVGAAS